MKDPDMQAASDEISAVLRKYDLMGVVLLSGKERTGWNIEISPSWSCVRPAPAEEGAVGFRIRSKREDYPTKNEQEHVLAETIGGIMGMLSNSRFVNESLSNLMGAVSQKVQIDHVNHDPNIRSARIDLEEEGT